MVASIPATMNNDHSKWNTLVIAATTIIIFVSKFISLRPLDLTRKSDTIIIWATENTVANTIYIYSQTNLNAYSSMPTAV